MIRSRKGLGTNDQGPTSLTDHLVARLFCTGRADCRLHILLFFRWRQNRGQSQRIDPKLPRPAGRVIEVLVLFFLDLIKGFFEYFGFRALSFFCYLSNELSIEVIFRFGFDDAFRSNQLGSLWFTSL